jgi:hypothetical protein
MEKPNLSSSQGTFETLTTYSTARMKADAETRALAPPLAAAWGNLKAAGDSHQAMENAMVAAMAMRDRVDLQVDDFVRALFRAAQGVYGAKGQRIKALYPDGLNALIKGPIPDQPGKMRVQATRLDADANETLAAGGEQMREKAAELQEAVDTFNLAVEQVAVAWGQVLRARSEWIRIYEKTYGELVALVGKNKADAYFKKISKRKKKKPAA